MSNQIVISSGAKVRSLEGVLTGTAGIVNSVPLGGANGVATLDSNGKVPLSQLPASVVTYLGTWNAATNTPTLTNGVGDAGDLYICNVAGTVNFGAGPITFAVGDWVIYGSGTWQKSSGQNGTVTSVAVTSTGNDAISITGSPITTAGTINIGFTGDNTQYINGAGDLTTFPSLTGYVPYTGATTDVDLGVHVLNAQALHVKGTAGAGHLGLKHQSAAATGSANESLIYANVDGDLAWQNDNLYLTTLSTHANTANRVYTFPDANGTIALTSNLSSYVPYTGATSNVDLGSHNLTTTGDLFAGSVTGGGIFAETNVGGAGYIYLKGNGTFGILSIYNSIFANGYKYGFDVQGGTTGAAKRAYLDFGSLTNSTTRTYSFPDASGTLALTSDIPSLTGYVPYTGATADVNLGTTYSLNGYKIGLYNGSSYTNIYGNTDGISINFGTYVNRFYFNNSNRTYTFPDATGTLVLGTGTTNYLPKFTGTSTIGNSMVSDDGTTLTSAGATRSNLYLKAASTSYYSQLAFTNGSSAAFGGLSYNNAGQYMQFETNSSEWMRLTSNGYLGIGTTGPSDVLDVQKNSNATTNFYFRNLDVTNTNSRAYLNVIAGNVTTSLQAINNDHSYLNCTNNLYLQTGGGTRMTITSSGNVGIGTSSPSYLMTLYASTYPVIAFQNAGAVRGFIGADSSSNIYNAVTGNSHVFQCDSTERMRITSGGNVLVGTTSDPVTGVIVGSQSANTWTIYGKNTASSGSPYVFLAEFINQSPNNTTSYFYYGGDSTQRFSVRGNGGIYNYSANNSNLSDARLKKEIIPLESYWNKFKAIEIVKFKYKDQTHDDFNIGVIAQQVELVAPEFVDSDGWDNEKLPEDGVPIKSIYEADLHHATIKVLQEAMAKIEELEAKVTALENK